MNEERKQKTILIVDDEQEILRLLDRLVRKDGYAALTASSAMEAFMAVQENNVDLVITDIRMPGVNGLELISQIHDLDSTIPAIVISGYGTFETIMEAVKRGAFFFLSKPFESQDLMEAVKKGLRLHHLTHEPGNPPPGTKLTLEFNIAPEPEFIERINYEISIAAHSMGFPYSIYSVNLPFIADELLMMSAKAAQTGENSSEKVNVKLVLTTDCAEIEITSAVAAYNPSFLEKTGKEMDIGNIQNVSMMMAKYFADEISFSADMKSAKAVITKARAVCRPEYTG